jgi:hypothetical protein
MPLCIQKNPHDPPGHAIFTVLLSLSAEALELAGGLGMKLHL